MEGAIKCGVYYRNISVNKTFKNINSWSHRLSVRTVGFNPTKRGSIPCGNEKIMNYKIAVIEGLLENHPLKLKKYKTDISVIEIRKIKH